MAAVRQLPLLCPSSSLCLLSLLRPARPALAVRLALLAGRQQQQRPQPTWLIPWPV